MKQTVYTASPESQQIHVWSLEADGKLTLVQVVDAPGQVQPMVVSPNKEFLYVGVRPEFRVLAYRITPDNGALTFAGEAALPGSPTTISTDSPWPLCLQRLLQSGLCQRDPAARWPAGRNHHRGGRAGRLPLGQYLPG